MPEDYRSRSALQDEKRGRKDTGKWRTEGNGGQVIDAWHELEEDKARLYRDKARLQRARLDIEGELDSIRNQKVYNAVKRASQEQDQVDVENAQSRVRLQCAHNEKEKKTLTREQGRLSGRVRKLTKLEHRVESRSLSIQHKNSLLDLKTRHLMRKRAEFDAKIDQANRAIMARKEDLLSQEDAMFKAQNHLIQARREYEREHANIMAQREQFDQERKALEVAKDQMQRTQEELESCYDELQKSRGHTKNQRLAVQSETEKTKQRRLEIEAEKQRLLQEMETIENIRLENAARKKKLEENVRDVQAATIKLKAIRDDLTEKKRNVNRMKQHMNEYGAALEAKQVSLMEDTQILKSIMDEYDESSTMISAERLKLAEEWNNLKTQKQTVQDTLKMIVDKRAQISGHSKIIQQKQDELEADKLDFKQVQARFEKEKLMLFQQLRAEQSEFTREKEEFGVMRNSFERDINPSTNNGPTPVGPPSATNISSYQ